VGKRGELLRKILWNDFPYFLPEGLELDAGCRKLGLKKIKFADFELRPPKVGGQYWVKA
jgi:hypothetical protein